MWKCPVCEKENRTLLCSHCGFDGSCNYESYPSLNTIPCRVDSIRVRKAALEEQEKDLAGLSVVKKVNKDQAAAGKNPDSKFWSKEPKPTSETVPCSPWGNRTLRLGNILIWMMLAALVFFCPYYIMSRSLDPAVGIKQLALPLAVMLLTVMMMQFNLKKKGVTCPKWLEWIWEFSGINSNSGNFRWLKAFANIFLLPLLMIKLIYPGLLVFFMGYFMGILGPIACMADFAAGRSSIQECFLQLLISMTFLYWALWHTVKLAHR